MLRKIRITAAVLCFTLVTLLFLDFTGTLHQWFGWTAKIQFFPALLALHIGVVAGLVLLTLLFGRVYCSVICPLGVFQDSVSWTAGKRKKPFSLLSCPQRAALRRTRAFHPRPAWRRTSGYFHAGIPAGTLQRVWSYGLQSAGTHLPVGQ